MKNRPSIYLAALLGADKKESNSWDQRNTIASDEVFVIQPSQLFRAVASEENQVDVNSHTERPICIDTKKPVGRQLKDTHKSRGSYNCAMKPWNWQRPEFRPALGPLTDISATIQSPKFPHDA
ncbi:MAG: hypothetical protein Q9216_003602 [Gyalolechia sp. 2 TL-2023]